jgi:hypothetical protein
MGLMIMTWAWINVKRPGPTWTFLFNFRHKIGCDVVDRAGGAE